MKTRVTFWLLWLSVIAWALIGSACSFIPAPVTIDRGARFDSAVEKERAARLELARRAQVETLVAELALRQAPPSRPVAVAQDATAAAASMTAAALGPVPEATRQETAATVAALVSDDPAARAPAEKVRQETAANNAAAAQVLDRREAKTEIATEKLRDGYADERATAKNWRRLVWGALLLLVAVIVAGILRLAWEFSSSGGALGALVAGIEQFKTTQPAAAETLAPILSRVMDAAHKRTVRRVKANAPR